MEIKSIFKYNEKININENFNLKLIDKKINQNSKKFYIQSKTTILNHNNTISSISVFPSGKIISVSWDCTIKIYDYINYKIIQNIKNAHDWNINYIIIKNENIFITCSSDKSIRIWIKNENNFEINQIIKNAHNEAIYKVIICSNGNLISCSNDKMIKIWKENNSKYELVSRFENDDFVYSILVLEDKNILISSGDFGTNFLHININNLKEIKIDEYFKGVYCCFWNSLQRINENNIIIGSEDSLTIISISEKKIIKKIDIPFQCNGIIIIKEKGIFLIGGLSNDIMIYRINDYENIEIIKNAHNDFIIGFNRFRDNLFVSFSKDKTIKIWSFYPIKINR